MRVDLIYWNGSREVQEAAESGSLRIGVRSLTGELLIGPLLGDRHSICADCFLALLQIRAAIDEPKETAAPAIKNSLREDCLAEARRVLAKSRVENLGSHIYRFHPGELAPRGVIPLPKRPGCFCGGAEKVPDEWGYWTNPLTGIVHNLAVTSGPFGPCFHAAARYCQPQGAPGIRNRTLATGEAYGRGRTGKEAEIACIAESLERYSMVWQGTEVERIAAVAALGEAALTPIDLLQLSDRQYSDGSARRKDPLSYHFVPNRWEKDWEIAWTPLQSWDDARRVWAPSEFVYLEREPTGITTCLADSNGCAAGASIEEAKERALMELIERDSLAIWWANRIQRPSIRNALAAEGLTEEILALAQEGIEADLIDLTTDLGIPVVCAVGHGAEAGDISFGASAGRTYREAGERALFELSQVWFWRMGGQGKDIISLWRAQASAADLAFLRPTKERHQLPVEGPAGSVVGKLAAVGLEAYWADLSRRETGLPVARAVVPGLAHFWKRYGCRRLFETPVRMGWTEQPKQEAELNDWPFPI